MVRKTKDNRKRIIKAEKYILLLLVVSYITGICSGCYFVLSNKENALFASYITINNTVNTAIFFILAVLLKYSGILSGVLYFLPFFSGIQNSANYCNCLLADDSVKDIILVIIKDTAVLLLLILYIIVIISQILNKKYNIKKDLKHFSVYFSGALIIFIIDYIIRTFIF